MPMITDPDAIQLYHMHAQLAACKLHLKGIGHSSGRSIIKYIKVRHHLKGNNVQVVAQFEAIVQAKRAEFTAARQVR